MINKFTGGDDILRDHLNEIVDALNKLIQQNPGAFATGGGVSGSKVAGVSPDLLSPRFSGQGFASAKRAKIVGFTFGHAGNANAAFLCRWLTSAGDETGNTFTVYVWSYAEELGSGDDGMVGTIQLSSDAATPSLGIGDIIPVAPMQYADGKYRLCCPFWFLIRGC